MAFITMVVETDGGGWGTEAAKAWSELAKTHSLASGELRTTVLSQLLGSLSIILHQENARAILRRTPQSLSAADGRATAILTNDDC